MKAVDEFIPFVDIETTGLEAGQHLILEVGMAIATRDFEIVDFRALPVRWSERDTASTNMSDFVLNMHMQNGLLAECNGNDAPFAYEVEGFFVRFIESWFGKDKPPMAGASLAMDRAFLRKHMSQVDEAFHYRSIDNSSTKELCRRLNPALYAKLPAFETDHRVKTCLEGTVAEAKFYADNFFYLGWEE